MKKLIYIIIGILILINILKPEFIKINEQEAQRCTTDMMQNSELICD